LNYTDIKVGDTISDIYLKEKRSFQYYKLHIGEDYNYSEDILIKVIPLDQDSDPDIYISKVPYSTFIQNSYRQIDNLPTLQTVKYIVEPMGKTHAQSITGELMLETYSL